MLKRLLAGVLTATALLAIAAEPATACQCSVGFYPGWAIGRAPIIFSGKIIEVRPGVPAGRPQSLMAIIDVLEQWKGKVPRRVSVFGSTSGASCGYSRFPVGETITMLAFGRPDFSRPYLQTDDCIMKEFMWDPVAAMRVLQEFRDERERIETALRTSPSSPVLLLDRARFLDDWNDPAAIDAYRDLVVRGPKRLPVYVGLARVLIREGRLDDAVRPLAVAQTLAPSDPETGRLSQTLDALQALRSK